MKANDSGNPAGLTFELAAGNSPRALQEVLGGLGRVPLRGLLNVALDFGVDLRKVRVALLTAAYLEAFRCLGYWFILNRNLDPVRAQILDATSDGFASRACVELTKNGSEAARLALVAEPISMQSVVFEFLGMATVLPKAEDRDGTIFEEIARILRMRERLALPWPPFQTAVFFDTEMKEGQPAFVGEGNRISAMMSHPDLETVRRLSDAPTSSMRWYSEAPEWAQAG